MVTIKEVESTVVDITSTIKAVSGEKPSFSLNQKPFRNNTVSVDLIYVSSGRKQAFFSIKSGKYVPVTKKFFKRWRKSKVAWWYMNAVITDNTIETYGVRAWNKAMTPDEHFKRTKDELANILRSRKDALNYIHVIAYPFSEELSEESINRIIRILEAN